MPIFLKNPHTDFHSDCTSFLSRRQWKSVPVAPHLCQHELSLVLLIVVILTDIRWNLKVVLIGISLMAKDVKFFNYLLAHCISSFDNGLCSSLTHLLIELLCLSTEVGAGIGPVFVFHDLLRPSLRIVPALRPTR